MILEPAKFLELYSQYAAGINVSEELLEELRPLAEAVASGFSNDDNHREDLIQECLERAYRSLPKYNPTKASPYNYYASVFRNRCITVVGKYVENITDDPTEVSDDVDWSAIVYDESIVLELVEHNRRRFPSIPADVLDVISTQVYMEIADGSSMHKFIKHYTALPRAEMAIVYNASLVWLRQRFLHTTYYTLVEPDELSLMVDVRELLADDDLYELMCTLFAGMRIQFPSK